VEGVVTKVVDGRSFGYTWAWAGEVPRQETLVTLEVEALPNGGSRVTFRHDGWAAAGANRATRDDHAGYWEGYLHDLAGYLDRERDTPG